MRGCTCMHKCTPLLAHTLESVSTKPLPVVATGGPQSLVGLRSFPLPYISTVSNGQTVSQLSQPLEDFTQYSIWS